MTDPTYPYVTCEQHPNEKPEPGYGVCKHVLNEGAKPVLVEKATTQHLGMLACAKCTEQRDADDFLLICAHGLRERGLLPVENWKN